MNKYIKLSNVDVEGIDTSKRAAGLRQIFMQRKTMVGFKHKILNNVTFSAKEGDIVGIVGRNGAGKSSLLKTIAGIYPITKGTIEKNGTIAPLIEMQLGFDFELSGRKNIRLALTYSGRIASYNKDLEKEIINFAELANSIDMPMKLFSSGMVERLAFAISVHQQPDILLLDEVLSAGDAHFVEKSEKYIEKMLESTPISLIVHHKLDNITRFCNRAIFLEHGEIKYQGTAEEVIAFARNPLPL